MGKLATGRKAAKRKVPFAVRGIEASEVAVSGDFTGWSEDGVRLERSPDGEWRTSLSLEPGEYQYRLRVDGRWMDDPGASARIPNPFGTTNAVLKVE
jgi:1,4-alpha-glucan branching enzyme